MENRITNAVALTMAIENLKAQDFNSEVIEKLTNIKNSYKKKSSGTRKPTATQIANEGLKSEIIAILENEPNRLFSVTEIVKALNGDYTNQKISALCSSLKKSNLIDKVEDKRKSYYKAI